LFKGTKESEHAISSLPFFLEYAGDIIALRIYRNTTHPRHMASLAGCKGRDAVLTYNGKSDQVIIF
jgi:hypothetical protein